MTQRRRRWLAALVVAPVLAVIPATAAGAHPLGNFTVNVYAGLVVQPDRLVVDYVVDMAEIPAFQERTTIDRNGDGHIDADEAGAYASSACRHYRTSVTAQTPTSTLRLATGRSAVTFPAGAAGLSTLRLQCTWAADLGAARTLRWTDHNFAERVGWHEVTANGDHTTLTSSDVSRTSVSRRLTAYPKNLLRSPLSEHGASITWRPGGPAYVTATVPGATSTATPLASDAASRWYTGLLANHTVTPAFALLALLVSALLGAVHALSPGHGKTAMSAYLVGSHGSRRDAVRLGLTMTLTHTTGVVVLGIGITTATAWAPERLYPWLSLASGLLIFATGAALLRRRRASAGHDHPHPHGHEHPHEHPHPHPSQRSVAALGLAGGMVPSPSAVVVLLGSLALHRAWLGVVLVIAYGVGMAAMLMTVGLVVARLAARLNRHRWRGLPRLLHRPAGATVVSSCAVMGAGLLVVGRSALQL